MSVPIELITPLVAEALVEDFGPGDIHDSIVDSQQHCEAIILSRHDGILCGQDWVNETCRQTDPSIKTNWLVPEGTPIEPNQIVLELYGPSYLLLRIERTVLNFLQLLTGTATRTNEFVTRIAHTNAKILDTRKTIPGWRAAQKYAVVIGGGENHRFGLWDAFLLKENHINAAGGIRRAIHRARKTEPNVFLEIEVETLGELHEALQGEPDRIMLDNFTIEETKRAVDLVKKYHKDNGIEIELEASGQINLDNVVEVAETGVDYISLGTLTKDVKAHDFSLQLE